MRENKITKIAVGVTIAVILFAAIGIAFVVTNGNNSQEQINAKKSDFITGVVNGITNDIENVAVSNETNNSVTNSSADNTTNTTSNSTKTNTSLPAGYSAVDEDVWATTTVRVRKSPSTDSDSNILGSLFSEQSVKRVAVGSDGWSKVIYKNQEAYVFSEYLTTDAPPERKTINVNVRGDNKVDPNKPMVCLTFDDGPNPVSSNRILDTLEAYNVRATFFDLGSLMAEYEDVVAREEKIGCEVCSHTYNHKNLNTLSKAQIIQEQESTEDQMQAILGHLSNLIRPPYGNANTTVRDALQDYVLIGWDIDTLDWKSKNASAVLSEVRKFSDYDGRIILMHSIYNSTAEAVETLVPELLEQGYQLVTVSEMIKYKGVQVEGGKLYYNFRDE